MKVNIAIQHTIEMLNQCHDIGLRLPTPVPGFSLAVRVIGWILP